jgi:hypothetical protein
MLNFLCWFSLHDFLFNFSSSEKRGIGLDTVKRAAYYVLRYSSEASVGTACLTVLAVFERCVCVASLRNVSLLRD